MRIDEIDRRLLQILSEDGRRANTEIAAELGVSEATIRARSAKLTSSGVLKVVALCNPLTLGHQTLRLQLTVRGYTPRGVAKQLVGMAMINHVALVMGAHDIYLEATCRDLGQVMDLLDDIRQLPGVVKIDQFILARLYKDYSWDGLRGLNGGKSAGSSEGLPGS